MILLLPLLPRKLSVLGPGLAWGDANGDGLDDLYMTGAVGQTGLLYHNLGNGQFVLAPTASVAAAEELAALWWSAGQTAQNDLLLSYSGVESGQTPYRVGQRLSVDSAGLWVENPGWADVSASSSGALAASDYDRDGDLDVFLG